MMNRSKIPASPKSDRGYPQVLRIANFAKSYRREKVIADVTFSVTAGEVLGLVGANGAGKTTLLETVAGLLAADSGAVFWRDEELPAARRKEALFYLPDGVRPWRDRFAIEVLSLFANIYGRSDSKVMATITSVGLTPVLHKRVHALSKGYNRRLLLALGFLTPHDVLLMDEPFDGLDLRQTRSIVEVVRTEAATGRALILAIHQLADAERVCDRFLLLAGGQIRGIGTLDELRVQAGSAGGSLEEIFLALT